MDVIQLEALKNLMEAIQEAFVENGFTLTQPMVLTHNVTTDHIVAIGVEMVGTEEDWHLEANWS